MAIASMTPKVPMRESTKNSAAHIRAVTRKTTTPASPNPKLATICSPQVRRSIDRDVLKASPNDLCSITMSGTTKNVTMVQAAPSSCTTKYPIMPYMPPRCLGL